MACIFPHVGELLKISEDCPLSLRRKGPSPPASSEETSRCDTASHWGDDEWIAWEISLAVLFVQLPVVMFVFCLFWKLLTHHTYMFAQTMLNIYICIFKIFFLYISVLASPYWQVRANNQSSSYANTCRWCRNIQRCSPSVFALHYTKILGRQRTVCKSFVCLFVYVFFHTMHTKLQSNRCIVCTVRECTHWIVARGFYSLL